MRNPSSFKEVNYFIPFSHFIASVLPILFALISVIMVVNLLHPSKTEAKSILPNGIVTPTLRWFEFAVVTSTVRSINVHEDYILWSAYLPFVNTDCEDYTPYPPPEAAEKRSALATQQIPEESWEICLYHVPTHSFRMLGSGGDLDYPDMYGDWVVMDRNHYIGTLRAENILTGEERDIWYKAYEEHSYPTIYQNTVVSSPENKSLLAYDLNTQSFTTIAYIPDFPDLWLLTGYAFDNLVIWEQITNAHFDKDLFAFDLTTQMTLTITAEVGHEHLIGMNGNTVYWLRDGAIYGRNLLNGQLFFLDIPGNQGFVGMSGNWLAWTDDRQGGSNPWNIYIYDITIGREYQITQEPQPILDFGFDKTVIAWMTKNENKNEGTQIRAVRLLPYSTFLPVLQQ